MPLARLAVFRAGRDPWAPYLEKALTVTASIVAAISGHVTERSLFSRLEPRTPRHPTGLHVHPSAPGTCGDCAWNRDRCLQANREVDPAWLACERFEEEITCQPCGACCREAYGSLELEEEDPFVTRHPDLVTREDGRLALVRIDGRCPPLEGDGSVRSPYWCGIYAERPQTCRDFERGGEHCLSARRRVGLSG